MSDAPGSCRACGAPVPGDAPGGLCPRCLIGDAIAAARESRGRPDGRPPAAEPAELAPLFPALEIEELVGRGGMGTVYRARQRRLDRTVALKLLDAEATRGASFSDRFSREARTLARLNHPNIVAVFDYGEVEGLHYLLMEFIDGANLREVLEAGRMSPEEALAVVPQVCEALQYAHEEGVVHRDIKPENILVDRKGRVKIADFGLAKMLDAGDPGRTLTLTGQVMGTPAYMAPEQIEHPGRVDHRADIYSLGVVFYEMLTGELPLGRFAPPSGKVEVDVRLDEVVLRTLAKEPERRYQRAGELKTAIESLDEPAPAETPAPKPPGPARGAADGSSGSTRVVEIRRPHGVTAAAIYCVFWFVLVLPSNGPREQGSQLGLFMLAIAGAFVAIGLWRLRRWARIAGAVLAGIGCFFVFPAGLAFSVPVGAYLLRKDVQRVFDLGRGPATLHEEEAARLAKLVREPKRRP